MNPWSFVFWEAVAILVGIGAVWLGRRRYGVDLVATACGAYLGGIAASALIGDARGWGQVVAIGTGALAAGAVSWTFVRDGDRHHEEPRSDPATPDNRSAGGRQTGARRGRPVLHHRIVRVTATTTGQSRHGVHRRASMKG
jgi:hypothetical protein